MNRKLSQIYHSFKVRIVGSLFILVTLIVAFYFAGSIFLIVTGKSPTKEPRLSLSFADGAPRAGALTELILQFPASPESDSSPLIPGEDGRYIHVFVANDELVLFGHDHPDDYSFVAAETRGRKEFRMPILFPKAGWYSLAVVYDTARSPENVYVFDVAASDAQGAVPKRSAPRFDMRATKNFQDYLISLTTNPAPLKTCAPAQLEYRAEKDGVPVSEFERVDAGDAIIAAWDARLQKFVHTKGVGLRSDNGTRLAASLLFTTPGKYQIFSEFKHHGNIIPSSFFVNVEGKECN